ncbi:hypothetical protein QBC36DRAFT_333000 [Triangularia setosa]|uniref:Uncharacterized protein n=1 Tax=Triangularia setosa TaxID=2587417 RepID=A0AAN7A656_9PEZI|nr:hypothetical protein QBC36DRAFT_333000 [Podospora setosa]
MPLRPQLFTLARSAYRRTFLPSSPLASTSTQLPHHHHHHHHQRQLLLLHQTQTHRKMASSTTSPIRPAPESSTSPTPGLSSSQSPTPSVAAPASTSATVRSAHVEDDTSNTTTKTATQNNTEPSANDTIPKPPLPALPAPGTETDDTPDAQKTTTVVVNGAPISLDALGPMVVNRDGTLARIANWQEMSSFERENTLRILGKRNQLRLATLRGDDNANTNKKE